MFNLSPISQCMTKYSGPKRAFVEVLIDECSTLHAVENEPQPDEPEYYLPHHAVVQKAAAMMKVQVAFDASVCTQQSKSVNDVLNPGPSFLPDLVGLLLHFRKYVLAMQADIRKAFSMIGVQRKDRQYLCILWPNQNGKTIARRLTKLHFEINCSPFILDVVLRLNLLEEQKEAGSSQEHDLIHLLKGS